MPKKIRKIILLEDDWVLSHTISKVLTLRGFVCRMPKTVEAVFSYLNQGDISLIVADLTLPWINTLELCRMVKHAKHFYHMPFVFISGSSDESNVKQAFLNGCDDFLAKPFHIQELLSALDVLLQMNPFHKEI